MEEKDGNIWIKEFPLTTNPNSIKLEEIFILKELVEKFKSENS